VITINISCARIVQQVVVPGAIGNIQSGFITYPFRGWSALSPVTIAAEGKRLAPGIRQRATGDAVGGGICGLEKLFSFFFAEDN
jgi:hypothetical protein